MDNKIIENIVVKNFGFVKCRSISYMAHTGLNNEEYRFSKGINKLYGDIDSGVWAISYLLSMYNVKPKDFILSEEPIVLVNGESVSLKDFSRYVCYMDCRQYPLFSGKKSVRDLVAEGIRKNKLDYSPEEIRRLFELSTFRFDRPVKACGNESVRTMAAIGFCHGKEVFCFPWLSKSQVNSYRLHLPITLKLLEKLNKTVIFPRGFSLKIDKDFRDSVCFSAISPINKTLYKMFERMDEESFADVAFFQWDALYSRERKEGLSLLSLIDQKSSEENEHFIKMSVVYKDNVYFLTAHFLFPEFYKIFLYSFSTEKLEKTEIGVFSLSSEEFTSDTFGGIVSEYCDGAIYVKDINHTVKYDMESRKTEEVKGNDEKIFNKRYEICCSDETLSIKDKKTEEIRTFNKYDILNSSAAGRRILELENEKTMYGKRYLDEFCNCISAEQNGFIYFVFTVLNYEGVNVPVIYKYCYENNKFYFLFSVDNRPLDCYGEVFDDAKIIPLVK